MSAAIAKPSVGSIQRARAARYAARCLRERRGLEVSARELLHEAGLDDDVPSLEYVLDDDSDARADLDRARNDHENRRR